MDELKERVIPASRRRTFTLLGFSLLLLLAAAFLPGGSVVSWLLVLLAGAGGIVALANLLPNASYLRVDRDGFEVCSLFRRHRFKWSEVESFDVARISFNDLVVFNFTPEYRRQELLRGAAQALAGWEGSLPDSYELSPRALASLMNVYRRRAREHRDGTAPGA